MPPASCNAFYNYSAGEKMQIAPENWSTYRVFREKVQAGEFMESDFGHVYVKMSTKVKS